MSENAAEHTIPDLSTPFANAVKLWHGEVERFFGEAEKGMERSFAMHRRVIDEQARLTEAQLSATQDTVRGLADGMVRLAKSGSEHR